MKLVIDIPEEYYKTIKETKKEVVPIGWASIRDGIKYKERPHGKWLTEPHSRIMHCSNCNAEENINKRYSAKWCYACGANMEIFGHWFPDWSESYGKDGFRCSVCDGWTSIKTEKCERCGIRMKEGDDNA